MAKRRFAICDDDRNPEIELQWIVAHSLGAPQHCFGQSFLEARGSSLAGSP